MENLSALCFQLSVSNKCKPKYNRKNKKLIKDKFLEASTPSSKSLVSMTFFSILSRFLENKFISLYFPSFKYSQLKVSAIIFKFFSFNLLITYSQL
ncbi:MAG: hypothetical protein LBC61_06530 [Candidatus Peribacteria bacterium]|nr:hypothetical protein [Candidatus Peribacteria bacterium]